MEKNKSILRTLISFSVPLVLSGLLQQLFSWADAFVLGRMEGEAALAALGATVAIVNAFIMLITGFTSGLTILSARYFGAGKDGEQRKLLGSFLVLFTLVMAVLAVAGIINSRMLLIKMETPADIVDMSARYLSIVLLGIIPLTVYNIYSAVLRGIGNSRMPFICLAASGILNVILDVILVGLMKMGVSGAALATALSQLLCCILTIVFTMKKYKFLRLGFDFSFFCRAVIIAGLTLALPVTAKNIINSLGGLILQNFMNSFGTVTVAAITTCYRVDTALLLPVINLATGIATMVSQSVGAADEHRAGEFLKKGIGLMIAVSGILALFIWFLGGNIVEIFGLSPDAVLIGEMFFRRLCIFYPVFGIALCFSGYLEGHGDVVYTGAASITALAIRIALSYMLVGIFDNMVIAWAETISWCCLLLMMFFRYLYKKSTVNKS